MWHLMHLLGDHMIYGAGGTLFLEDTYPAVPDVSITCNSFQYSQLYHMLSYQLP
jgi:hypothetical protein